MYIIVIFKSDKIFRLVYGSGLILTEIQEFQSSFFCPVGQNPGCQHPLQSIRCCFFHFSVRTKGFVTMSVNHLASDYFQKPPNRRQNSFNFAILWIQLWLTKNLPAVRLDWIGSTTETSLWICLD